MLIEKDLIKKAKEKLGNRNAELIAEILELPNFDTKNLKSCCPYHSEKTPSFIYNHKNQSYKCFGCGKSVDLIDVQMEKGKSFLDAAKFLFEQAEVECSFGEQSVKTKRNYRYPHEEPLNDKESVYEYLNKRGISKDVIDYLDIREDKQGNCVFNYYDTNDVLSLVKYRPSHKIVKGSGENKNWSQKDADTTPLLFNMNRVNTSKPLLIAEGELDAASAIEAGYLNTVSVPFGAGNYTWIEENWEWLNQFDTIIIWSDNDEAGLKMRKECLYRLGTWRTKYIATPEYYEKDGKQVRTTDINECLYMGGKEYVMELIANAQDVPVTSVVDYSDLEELDISEMDGVITGIKPVDKALIKIFYGTLTVLSGRPAAGKTSIIDQMIAQTIDKDTPVFLFSKEMPERHSANWFNSILAGRRNMKECQKNGEKFSVVPYDIQKKMQKFYEKKLFIYRDDEPNDVESVMKSAEECVRKYGCKLIALDNLMMLDLHCSESDKNTAQTNLMNMLIKFAAKFNVAVVLIAHPRKMQDKYSDIDMYDISGTSNIINLAMRSIGLRRVSEKEKADPKSKWKDYDVVLTVMKDRLLGKTDFQVGLWYDIVSRRFYTDYDEFDVQYKWDDNIYETKLPYIDRTRYDEDFPDD